MRGAPPPPRRTGLVRSTALLAALCLLAGACTLRTESREDALDGDVTDPPGERVEGGRVVVGHEHEPIVLNPLLAEGNLRATVMATRPVLLGAYMVTPDFRYVPDLLDGEAEPAGGQDEPFTVTWRIREEATWSDGTPISANDFAFTYDTMLTEEWDIETLQRAGFDEITETEIVDDKTWRATFSGVFAPYRDMFATVLPAHVLEGEDFNEVWNEGITDPDTGEAVGSGPFLFGEWDAGHLTLVRNDDFWGSPATLEEITFRYAQDVPTALEQLDAGQTDLYVPQQPLPAIVDRLRAMADAEVQVTAGPVWEHLTFNLDNDLLAEPYVREAIARGIDREQVVEELLGAVHPDATVLHDPLSMEQQRGYEPAFGTYSHDPEAAVALLEDNGCTREDEGVFTCDGQELSFGYLTTAGNERRQQLFATVAGQLADIGIEMVDELAPPAEALRERLPAGGFDIANFAWVGGVDPHRGEDIFACDGALNYGAYCNEDLSALLAAGRGTVDARERTRAYNEASGLIAEDLPLLPLFQLPEALAIRTHVGGVQLNPTAWGATWNASQWYLTEQP